jgi:4-amino-4-deoxy-L-arabinose transferase-like glycosyltransferase
MILQKQYSYIFYISLCCLVAILFFTIDSLSISYKEALNVFINDSVLSYVTNTSIFIFGQNDYALRLPFILFYVLSVFLMYQITNNYFKYEKDRLLNIILFMLLPGVISASLLVNSAIIVTFFTLLYIYLFDKTQKHNYYLLAFLLFIDNSFAILFLAIFFQNLKTKDKKTLGYFALLFIVSILIYGFDTSGKPKGYLLDTFAIYSSVFSPLIFIFFIYTIYRIGIKKEQKSLIWYISVTAILISFLLSFRQRINIEDFAPYVVVSLPLVLKTFLHSYRIRLPEFRKKHNISIALVLLMLFINIFLTIVNKPLYLILDKANKHFVYKYHFVKELAKQLEANGINDITTINKELLLRLKFYNINEGNKYLILMSKPNEVYKEIKINYYGKDVITYYVVKLNE